MIHEELKLASNSKNYEQESEDDEKLRVQNMVFGQLVTACYNMVGFQVNKDIVREVVFCFAKQNGLNDEFINLLETTLNSVH